jgi:hypothetical protein
MLKDQTHAPFKPDSHSSKKEQECCSSDNAQQLPDGFNGFQRGIIPTPSTTTLAVPRDENKKSYLAKNYAPLYKTAEQTPIAMINDIKFNIFIQHSTVGCTLGPDFLDFPPG